MRDRFVKGNELTTDTDTAELVTAAQAGDTDALETLVRRYLPLLYNIIGRAMDNRADVDDVVQETMLRVVRDLHGLRSPASFRSWLVAIALHQTSYRNRVRRNAAQRRFDLAGEDVADPNGDFTELTILRLGLSGQRRSLVEATRWLESDARETLSLWWLEILGELTRQEIATALRVSAAHAGVRVQRLLTQLESARTLVEALAAVPRCPGLSDVAADWDGTPTPRWRKRLLRHVRDCPRCDAIRTSLIPPDRLLAGLGLVPVPADLVDSLGHVLGAKSSAATATANGSGEHGTGGHTPSSTAGSTTLAKSLTVVASVLVTLATAYVMWPDAKPPPRSSLIAAPAPSGFTSAPSPTPSASPSAEVAPKPSVPATRGPANAKLTRGAQAFRSVDTRQYISAGYWTSDLQTIGESSSREARATTALSVVAGLARSDCYSLRTSDGRYLRHYNWRLVVQGSEDTKVFRGDATYCARPGSRRGTWRLESANYPGKFIHHRGTELWVEADDGTNRFAESSTFEAGEVL